MILTSAQLLRADLPIGLSATLAERVVVYSLPFTADPLGLDEVLVLGRFQVTNPYTYIAMVGSYICRTTDPAATTGWTVARPVAKNVTPDEHHFPCERIDVDACPPGDWFYNLVLYTASVNSKPDQSLRVDPYGKILAHVRR